MSTTAQINWGGTAVLVRRGIIHHSVPVPDVTHLEATPTQVPLAGRPVKILAYLSPSRPLIGADLDACYRSWLSVLLAGDLNAKHVDWNSRLSTRRGKLCVYADENTCLIFGPDTPTTHPYNSSATPDVSDITAKHLPCPVYLTSCTALSLDHLPVIIDIMCLSSFLHPPDPLISGALFGPTSRSGRKTKFRSTRNYTMGWQSKCALRTCPLPF